MADPISLTFEFLATAPNPAAGEALLTALDVPDETIRIEAAEALLRRPEVKHHLELLCRLDELGADLRNLLHRTGGTLEPALRQALMRPDLKYRQPALRLVRALREFKLLPVLLNQLENQQLPDRADVLDAFMALIDRLYDAQQPGAAKSGEAIRDFSKVLAHVLQQLDQSAERYLQHQTPQIVEALLALAPLDHPECKKILRHNDHPAHEVSDHLLLTSTHPGVLQRLMESLGETYPLQRAIQVIQTRTDPEFLCHWLRALPKPVPLSWETNLGQMTHIAALRSETGPWAAVPTGLLERLIVLTQHTGLSLDEKRTVYEWVLRHGETSARKLATDLLSIGNEDAVRDIVVESLQADEATVQAWATSQLRAHAVPHAFQLLIERLDSPVPEVQAAARAELGDFNVKRFLETYADLEPALCVQAAKLVLKIDSEAIMKIRDELQHMMRSKRIRAAEAVAKGGLADLFIPELLDLLQDADPGVRLIAVHVLGPLSHPEIHAGLLSLIDDPSPRVRIEVQAALQAQQRAETN